MQQHQPQHLSAATEISRNSNDTSRRSSLYVGEPQQPNVFHNANQNNNTLHSTAPHNSSASNSQSQTSNTSFHHFGQSAAAPSASAGAGGPQPVTSHPHPSRPHPPAPLSTSAGQPHSSHHHHHHLSHHSLQHNLHHHLHHHHHHNHHPHHHMQRHSASAAVQAPWRARHQSSNPKAVQQPKQFVRASGSTSSHQPNAGEPLTLLDLSAKIVAEYIPFQSIEQKYERIPEPVQKRIIFWSFPRHEDDIRMYSSLANDTFATNGPSNSSNTTNAQSSPATHNHQASNGAAQSSSSTSPSSSSSWVDQIPRYQSAAALGMAAAAAAAARNGTPPPPPEAVVAAINASANPDHPTAPTNTSTSASGALSQSKSPHHKQLTFHKGLRLYSEGCVHDVLQIGFNLSGAVVVKYCNINQTNPTGIKVRSSNTHHNNHHHHHHLNGMVAALNNQSNSHNDHHHVNNHHLHHQALSNSSSTSSSSSSDNSNNSLLDQSTRKSFRVSVTFDRCKITSVSCSCELQDIFWCEHAVALIIYRIRNPETIDLRVPISETLLSLDRQQLQKLVQYIIAEHHTEVLPTAQRLLDEMRQSFSEINQIQGAPDPTAGACADDEHIWHLDEQQVNEKVQTYLNLVCSNSKDAHKQINALFEKIREMFRAKDSNSTRMLKLITEQFLYNATRNEKSRPLWDQLISLWVVVMLNPDIMRNDQQHFVKLLTGWSRVIKCPKEDVELRRITYKRKAAELSDDEDFDDVSHNRFVGELALSTMGNGGNNYPAHMATHRHRAFQNCNNNTLPVLRPYNHLSVFQPSTCPCQSMHSMTKKMRGSGMPSVNDCHNRNYRANGPSDGAHSSSHNHLASSSNENRPNVPQEPRSVFHRALDCQEVTWDDSHLQLILNKDGPFDFELGKTHPLDYAGNPLWNEPISQSAARVETLRSHGYREQALRLTVATVRCLKLYQDQWCRSVSPNAKSTYNSSFLDVEAYSEGWIGHPFDPINALLDLLLDASLTEAVSNIGAANVMDQISPPPKCPCLYNQALVDITHRLLPDLAPLSYQRSVDNFTLPPVNLAQRRIMPSSSNNTSDKTQYYHVPVPGCYQKESYLTLAVELALMALGQQRSMPTISTAHDRAVRQEADIINKLESIDTSDPLLLNILKHQTWILLEGGPFHHSCCGISSDSAPLHTYAKYLFESLVNDDAPMAYKVGIYALKMPLAFDENSESYGAARTSPRSISHSHLQSEQLALAQTMLSRAKDDSQSVNFLKKVYRASVKNVRNPASLLKLAKHVLKEAKPSGTTQYPSLLKTAFDLGLQVLKVTLTLHASSGKTRREAILFIVDCATDMGFDTVLQLMKDARDYFSAMEALNLVVPRDNDHVNLRSQASTKFKLKDNPAMESELNSRARDLALECAGRDPTNCVLEALKFCESNEEALCRALKIVIEAGTNGALDSTQLIKVADYVNDQNMCDRAFEIALVAVNSLTIPSNSDNNSSKKDIMRACEYALKVNGGFSTLLPKLISNIECATILSEIYNRFNPNTLPLLPHGYNTYSNEIMAHFGRNLTYSSDILYTLRPEIYKQRLEDARWWDALLKRTLKAFVDTTRTRLQNISPRHYGEFIEFLVKAQETFEKASDGPQQFKDLISEIIKSYRTKKKLMERLKARFDYSIKTGM